MIEMPIADFFKLPAEEGGGETAFREVEYQILMEMAQYTRLVLATGGGIVERRDNWGLLRHGLVVFLDANPEDIATRLSSNSEELAKRPLLQQSDNPLNKLQELSSKRRDMYLQADIHCKVEPQWTPEQVADRVVRDTLEFIAANPPLWQSWKAKRDQVAVEAAARVSERLS